MTVACFDPSGKSVFFGTSNGNILVFNTRTKMVRSLNARSNKTLDMMITDDCTTQNLRSGNTARS
jgi:hypothetical protein